MTFDRPSDEIVDWLHLRLVSCILVWLLHSSLAVVFLSSGCILVLYGMPAKSYFSSSCMLVPYCIVVKLLYSGLEVVLSSTHV